MSTYSVTEIIGKTLFAARNGIIIRSYPSEIAPAIRVIAKNERIGTVYSYAIRSGSVWYMLDKEGSQDYAWIKHNKGDFDIKALQSQGAKTEAQLQAEKEAAEKGYLGRLFDKLPDIGATGTTLKYFIPVLLVILGAILVFKFYKIVKP